MNKAELVSIVSDKLECTKADGSRAFEAVFDALIEGLVAGEKVKTPLGTLKVADRKARTARNPQTGEAVAVPAYKTIKLIPSTIIKDKLNG